MDYNKSSHTVFYHRFHIVWITKYRYKVLQGNLRIRVREIIAQAAERLGIRIINGVLSADHVHIMAEIPPHVAVSQFVKVAKGRSSRKFNKNFLKSEKHIGDVIFGEEVSSVQLVVMLPMILLITALLHESMSWLKYLKIDMVLIK